MNDQEIAQYLESVRVKPEVSTLPAHKRALGLVKKVLKDFPKYLGLYLGLCGLWGFSAFICEESIQTAQFSSWQAIPCEEWRLVKSSITTMESARTTMLIINNVGGQINPLAYFSYQAYGAASLEYINALKARTFANAPELFDGETMTFTFNPNETEPQENYFVLKNGKISILSFQEKIPQVITGKIQVIDGKIIVDLRDLRQGQEPTRSG